MSDLLVCVGFLLVLFGYATFCGLFYTRRERNRFWWTCNRVRAALALERDPGTWRSRT